MPEPLDVTRRTIFAEDLEKEIERGRFPLLGASQEASSIFVIIIMFTLKPSACTTRYGRISFSLSTLG
jgi:hypothetical protein